jgi:hypothetical protein
MKINKVVGQNRLENYLILYLDPELDKGLNGNIICRKVRLKGFEYETVPSFDSKYIIAFESDSDDNFIGEIVEYE